MIGEGCVYIPAVLRDYSELKRWIEFCEIPIDSWFPVTITDSTAKRIAAAVGLEFLAAPVDRAEAQALARTIMPNYKVPADRDAGIVLRPYHESPLPVVWTCRFIDDTGDIPIHPFLLTVGNTLDALSLSLEPMFQELGLLSPNDGADLGGLEYRWWHALVLAKLMGIDTRVVMAGALLEYITTEVISIFEIVHLFQSLPSDRIIRRVIQSFEGKPPVGKRTLIKNMSYVLFLAVKGKVAESRAAVRGMIAGENLH